MVDHTGRLKRFLIMFQRQEVDLDVRPLLLEGLDRRENHEDVADAPEFNE
jgi:hypothetical protein